MPKNQFVCDCDAIHTDIIQKALSRMPSENVFKALAAFYKIIGDPTRCKIIFALQQNEMCVCDLANVLSMTKSSISHQLSKMRSSGVVKCRRSGKEVYYALDDEHIDDIFAVAMAHIQHQLKEETDEN